MATILFYLRKPKSDTQNVREEFPINLKFTIDREHRLELSLGERIKPAHWNPDKQEAKSNYRGYIELNLYLSKLKQDLLQMWRDNRDKDFDTIKELTRGLVKYGEATKCKSLLEVFSDFLTQYSTEKDKKTIKKYNSLKINLTEFSKNYTVLLDKTDFNFYDRFKSFLYQRRNPNYPGQYLHKHPVDNYWYMSKTRSPYPACIFDDTVYKYISNLKAFLSWAEKRGHEVHESYKSWEIITRTYKHISLSLPELEQIEAAEMPTKSLELARDYFILECRTGQRISDIKAFNKKDFENGKWSFYRKKGSRLSPKKVTVHFSGYSAKALTIFAK